MSVKKIKAVPQFNFMFVTCNKKPASKSGIIIVGSKGDDVIDLRQTVLKVGETVRTLKPGYEVEIDPRPYFVKQWKDQSNPTLNEELHKQTYSIAWPIEEIDGVEVMVIPDNHVRYHWPLEDK